MSSTCSTYKKHYKCVEPPKKIKLLIVAEAPPKKDENYFYCLANSNTECTKRQFFRNIMKGVGLLRCTKWPKEENKSKENKLLEAFLENDYFLIDTCPEPLKGKKTKEKIEEMVGCVCNLICQIRELNPKKVLFVTRTNESIRKLVAKKFPEGKIYEKVLNYPGNGWSCKFIEDFPPEYRLSPIF